uniref:G-protein coupled receptors family 1 profile domain-containing protein n=1 Tax=Ditylenchus dipsaci TaxID=166011 RepID=A0A915DIT9_9BILA
MLEARAEPVDSLNNLPLPLVILLAIPATIIILLTIFGNLLVLCFKARVGRSNTTLLVWNLGLTDFLVGVIVLPLGAIHLLYRKWVFGRALCRIWVAADVTFCTCSVVTICTISVDRYLAVTRPLRYKSVITKCKVILVIIVIWTFSSAILLTTVRWDGWGDQDDVFDETALRVHIGRNNGMVEHQRRARMTRNVAGKTKMGRKNKNSNALNSSKSPIKRRSTTPAPYNSTRRNNPNNGLRSQFSEKRRRVPIDSMLEQRKLLNTEEEEYVQIIASQTARPFHSNYEYGGDYPVNNTTSTLSRSTETLSSSTNDLIRMPCRYSLKRHSSPATTILRRTSTISNFLLAKKRRPKVLRAAQARNWLLTSSKRRIEWNNNSIVATRANKSLEIELVQSRCQSEAIGEGSHKKGRRNQLLDGWTRQQSADNAELVRNVEDTRLGNRPVLGKKKEVTLRSALANGPAICRHMPKQMSLEVPHPKLTVNSTQCCSVRVYCTTNETDL